MSNLDPLDNKWRSRVSEKVCILLCPALKLMYRIHTFFNTVTQATHLICANIQQINSKPYSRNNYVQVQSSRNYSQTVQIQPFEVHLGRIHRKVLCGFIVLVD